MRYLFNDPSSKPTRRKLRHDQTDVETLLWARLRNKRLDGFKFYRQFSFGPYILDFYCPQCLLAVELDGGQHLNNKADESRAGYLEQHGIEVVRFWNHDALQNMEVVVESIWKRLMQRKSKKSNSP